MSIELTNQAQQITWFGRFVDAVQETRFRNEGLTYYRRVTMLVGLIVMVGSFAFIANDVRGGDVQLEFVLPRLLLGLAAVAAIWVNHRARDWRATYFVIFFLSLGVCITVGAIDYQRPADFIIHLGVDVIVLMGIYVALPTIPMQLVLSLGYTTFLLWLHFALKEPAYVQANLTVPLTLVLANLLGVGMSVMYARVQRQVFAQMHSERTMRRELEEARERVAALSDLLPVCASCKKVRDDSGYWNRVEHYLQDLSGQRVSHGICPDCIGGLLETGAKT